MSIMGVNRTEFTADSARGRDGSIGVFVGYADVAVYVDLLPDGRARVFLGVGDERFEKLVPSPPQLDPEDFE